MKHRGLDGKLYPNIHDKVVADRGHRATHKRFAGQGGGSFWEEVKEVELDVTYLFLKPGESVVAQGQDSIVVFSYGDIGSEVTARAMLTEGHELLFGPSYGEKKQFITDIESQEAVLVFSVGGRSEQELDEYVERYLFDGRHNDLCSSIESGRTKAVFVHKEY